MGPTYAEKMRIMSLRMCGLLAVVLLMLLGLPDSAAAQGKRLILKDGSVQEVVEYEVHGERISYLSSQRWEWEELPSSYIDWRVTQEWNNRPLQISPEEDEDNSNPDRLAVAPGARLPRPGGVFLLDTFSSQLLELTQQKGEMNRDRIGVFHSALTAKGSYKQRLELKGPVARTQAHAIRPRFFIKLAESNQEKQIASLYRFRIAKLDTKVGVRILASFTVALNGKQVQKQEFVPEEVHYRGEGWSEILPLEDLSPGEYAIVEMLNESQFNRYVWDFGIASRALDIAGVANDPKP